MFFQRTKGSRHFKRSWISKTILDDFRYKKWEWELPMKNTNCTPRALCGFFFLFFSCFNYTFWLSNQLAAFSLSARCRQGPEAEPQQVQLCFEGRSPVRCSHVPVILSHSCARSPYPRFPDCSLQALSSLHKANLQIRTSKVKALQARSWPDSFLVDPTGISNTQLWVWGVLFALKSALGSLTKLSAASMCVLHTSQNIC